MNNPSANRLELLQIAEAVAQEKMIDPEIVRTAMEESWAKAARSKFGSDLDIRATIDPETGDLTVTRVRKVVEEVENSSIEIGLEDARKEQPDIELGNELIDILPNFELGRIQAQAGKQVVQHMLREAERERQYQEFKDRVGEIVVGTVKREEFGNIILDINRGEAVLRREQKIGRESYVNGDRLRAYIMSVRREARGPQILLSRVANEFLVELFRSEVPEIYEGIIEIKSVARDPGSRAKIAVLSHESSIDPVGACVGMRGSRVQTVVNELQGERIDIIPWTEDKARLVIDALQPAVITKVCLDETGLPKEVVVNESQLSIAIGRRGQNVRLAYKLTGLDLSILTEEEEMERRTAENNKKMGILMEALDIDDVFAHLLVAEGFETPELLAASEMRELLTIGNIDEATATELLQRAKAKVETENSIALERARDFGLEDSLATFGTLTPKMLEALARNRIRTLKDFADCADWELAGGFSVVKGKRVKDDGILEHLDVTLEEAGQWIVEARLALGIVKEEDLVVKEETETIGDDNPEM